jgi:putative addiction module killer protein
MHEILQSDAFKDWLSSLSDRRARARILARIDRLAMDNPGDVEPVGNGISEMRVHYGPGYRVYFLKRGRSVVVLLCGGDKSTQRADIRKAKLIAEDWRN